MKHRQAPYDFTIDPLPISIGELERLLRNNSAAVGSLYEIISDTLFDTPGFRANKVWFSLVNVTCKHTGFSYGIMPTPPKSARPLSATWLYTFAISNAGYGEVSEASHVSLRGINSIAWGHRKGSEFITIGTPHYQAGQLGLSYDLFTPQYLYYLLGALTKNFAMRARFHTVDTDYRRLYQSKDLSMLRSQYYMMPLHNLLRILPYHLLVFNRHMWTLGVNLLSPRHITPESLMYMCQNIRTVSKLPEAVENAVVDMFHESLTDMLQRQESGDSGSDTWQLLYAALVNRGNIPTEDTNFWLSRQETSLVAPSGNYSTHILKLLYA